VARPFAGALPVDREPWPRPLVFRDRFDALPRAPFDAALPVSATWVALLYAPSADRAPTDCRAVA
jgi:hypothetical protein